MEIVKFQGTSEIIKYTAKLKFGFGIEMLNIGSTILNKMKI